MANSLQIQYRHTLKFTYHSHVYLQLWAVLHTTDLLCRWQHSYATKRKPIQSSQGLKLYHPFKESFGISGPQQCIMRRRKGTTPPRQFKVTWQLGILNKTPYYTLEKVQGNQIDNGLGFLVLFIINRTHDIQMGNSQIKIVSTYWFRLKLRDS